MKHQLTASDFPDFFKSLNGNDFEPFPWQRDLVKKVLDDKAWPQTIDLPTSFGKTSCLQVALFALACLGNQSPRRIFFVVDRRIIVDAAYQKAQEWAKRLKNATGGTILHKAKENLEYLAGEGLLKNIEPLKVYQLRGGVYRDSSWIENPLAPSIICTTVDQVGSRLFFRGYGVSEKTLPRHAALAGNDSLIILDEAHCSRPFEQTMRRFEQLRKHEGGGNNPVKTAPQFVVMSATPVEFAEVREQESRSLKFSFGDSDKEHPLLAQRLSSVKETQLVVAEGVKGDKFEVKLSKKLLDLTKQALENPDATKLAVMVNNVSTARKTAELLQKKLGKSAEVVLMTGRMRELDRRDLLTRWEPVLRSGSKKKPSPPVVVVATQCLEVGADFDFDSMITECASLSAIEQRFGRLDRLGEKQYVRAWLVVREDQQEASEKKADPIYGAAMPNTWQWLKAHSTLKDNGHFIDLGIGHLRELKARTSGEERDRLNSLSQNAPILLPPYIDCWVQTSPRPCPEAEVAPFLRGEERASNDVRVIWRDQVAGRSHDDLLEELVLRPPSVSESLAVPIALFRAWVTPGQKTEGKGEDIEGFGDDDASAEDRGTLINPSLRSRIFRFLGVTDEKTKFLTSTRDIRPNDLFIVDSDAEGSKLLGDFFPCDSPEGEDAVRWDRGDEAQLLSRQKAVLTLSRSSIARLKKLAASSSSDEDLRVWQEVERLLFQERSEGEVDFDEFDWDPLWSALGRLSEPSSEAPGDDLYRLYRIIVRHLLEKRREPIQLTSNQGSRYLLTAPQRINVRELEESLLLEEESDPVDDTFRSLETEQNIRLELREHCARVGALAFKLATRLGLSAELSSDLKLSGELHDLGKADLRFQAWLCDGSRAVASSLTNAVAKSGKRSSLSEMKRNRREAGYPKGKRHEFLSAAVIHEQDHLLATAHDRDLVHYLVAVHHGFARPFPLEVDDPESCELKSPELFCLTRRNGFRSDFGEPAKGHAERFWRLVNRYGWWQLALLETILTSADGLSSGDHDVESRPTDLSFIAKSPASAQERGSVSTFRLELPGLQGTNLLAFLAALGTFRQLSRALPDQNLRLAWKPTSGWTPVLQSSTELGEESLLDALVSALDDEEFESFLSHPNYGDLDPNKYEEKAFSDRARELLGKALDGDPTQLDWLCAFAAPVHRYVAGKRDNVVGNTAFRTLGAGRTSLLAALRELRKVTRRKHLAEALFSRWTYGDLKNNLRLDPIDDRRYALMGSTPTDDAAEPTKTMWGANRLAMEAFPLFPVWPGIRRVDTAGFITRGSNNTYFHWPIWTGPLGLQAVRSLLWVRNWHEHNPAARESLTIAAVYRSQRFNFGKYRNFAPAQELPQKPEEIKLELPGRKIRLLRR